MTISDLRNAAIDSGAVAPNASTAVVPGKPKAKRTWRSYSVYAGLALIFAYCLAPFYWMIVSSLRRTADISDNTLLPSAFSLENYGKVFDGSTMFGQAMLNSLIDAGTTTVFALVLGVFAAYTVSRLTFRFESVILGIIAMSISPASRWWFRCCASSRTSAGSTLTRR